MPLLALALLASAGIAAAPPAREPLSVRNDRCAIGFDGRTGALVGIGNVGTRVAELCRGLFAMRVIATDPNLSAEEMARRGAEKVDLDTLMQQADFVSVNCPLDDGSRGMIGAHLFGLMKPTAFFITTARGFIHDEAALAAGHRVEVVPGPSAVTTALVGSGLPSDRFLFVGFLPRKSGERRALLAELAAEPGTLVAFEAPHRLLDALDDLLVTLGDRPVAVARELAGFVWAIGCEVHNSGWQGMPIPATAAAD